MCRILSDSPADGRRRHRDTSMACFSRCATLKVRWCRNRQLLGLEYAASDVR